MAAPVQAQTTCNALDTSLTFPPNMLHFDNKGQSFISAHHSNNLTKLTEVTQRVTVCATQNSTPTLRRLAQLAHSLISFRVQFTNAYVLHEYAYAEIGHRFGTRGIMVGASPTRLLHQHIFSCWQYWRRPASVCGQTESAGYRYFGQQD